MLTADLKKSSRSCKSRYNNSHHGITTYVARHVCLKATQKIHVDSMTTHNIRTIEGCFQKNDDSYMNTQKFSRKRKPGNFKIAQTKYFYDIYEIFEPHTIT